MGDVAHAADDADHAAHFVELDDPFGQVEIDGAASDAAGIEGQGQGFHAAKIFGERGVTRSHFRVAFEDFVHVGVGHALDGTNDAGSEFGFEDFAAGVELENGAHDQAIDARIERANAIGELLRQHGNGAVGKINGSAAEAGFAVELRAAANVMSHVGDMHLELEAAAGARRDVDGIVEVLGGLSVDGDDGKIAKIAAADNIFGTDLLRDGARLREDFVSETHAGDGVCE